MRLEWITNMYVNLQNNSNSNNDLKITFWLLVRWKFNSFQFYRAVSLAHTHAFYVSVYIQYFSINISVYLYNHELLVSYSGRAVLVLPSSLNITQSPVSMMMEMIAVLQLTDIFTCCHLLLIAFRALCMCPSHQQRCDGIGGCSLPKCLYFLLREK